MVNNSAPAILQNVRWPVKASRMAKEVTQRSNQVATDRRFRANDVAVSYAYLPYDERVRHCMPFIQAYRS